MERTITNIIPRAAPNFFRGRQDSASGLIPPSPEKGSLRTSKEKVFLHRSAVHFSTGTAVQFSPGIYTRASSYGIASMQMQGAMAIFTVNLKRILKLMN